MQASYNNYNPRNTCRIDINSVKQKADFIIHKNPIKIKKLIAYLNAPSKPTLNENLNNYFFNKLSLMDESSDQFLILAARVELLYDKLLDRPEADKGLAAKAHFYQGAFDLPLFRHLNSNQSHFDNIDYQNLIGLSIFLYDQFMQKNPLLDMPECQSAAALASFHTALNTLSDFRYSNPIDFLAHFPELNLDPEDYTRCLVSFIDDVNIHDLEKDSYFHLYMDRNIHPFFSQIFDSN